MTTYELFVAWCAKNAPWLGYIVMSVMGGVVAHIREWEQKHPGMGVRDHLVGILRRATMATLAGLLWFLIMQQNSWQGQPYAYVGASLVGMFAPEFFDLLWSLVKKRITGDKTQNTENKP